MFKKPVEWASICLGVIAMDIYYYKTQKRDTLSAVIKKMNKDPVIRSLLWSAWGWMTYHFFFEKD